MTNKKKNIKLLYIFENPNERGAIKLNDFQQKNMIDNNNNEKKKKILKF